MTHDPILRETQASQTPLLRYKLRTLLILMTIRWSTGRGVRGYVAGGISGRGYAPPSDATRVLTITRLAQNQPGTEIVRGSGSEREPATACAARHDGPLERTLASAWKPPWLGHARWNLMWSGVSPKRTSSWRGVIWVARSD